MRPYLYEPTTALPPARICVPFMSYLAFVSYPESRFLGVNPISLQALFTPPGGDKAVDFAMATEAALVLLIWGEVREGLVNCDRMGWRW